MKKYFLTFAAVAMASTGTVATAAPDNKPVHAATPSSGQGCIVRAGEDDPYQVDADCSFHQVVKRNKDGSLRSFRYHDKGTLQDGQEAPDRAVRISLDGFVLAGLECTGTEIISPSGNYSSNLKCR